MNTDHLNQRILIIKYLQSIVINTKILILSLIAL